MPITNIKDLVSSFVDDNKKRNVFNERKVVELWKAEMGDFITSATQKIDISNGILKVKINNAALKFELLNRRSELIKVLNDKIGSEVVGELIIY
ncbi:MAG: DUF721 domain-containing protein [Bacteroidales bacterium]|nr:DUF721 domain-containing protein [Bacteroidales bacterium]